MSLKILLTGRQGQVGFELRRALASLGTLVALDRTKCDLSDTQQVRTVIRECRPDVIVNPAAYTAVDLAETQRDLAYAINATAVGVLGEEAAALGALVVHYSTDYVFDGTSSAPYRESDLPNPQSLYGASKLAGEEALASTGCRHIILRTSWVVGAYGSNFAKTILRLAAERDRLNIVADQWGAPTSAALLADLTAHIVRQASGPGNNTHLNGVYHASAGGRTNWHAYACHVINRARAAGGSIRVAADAIHPIPSSQYPTPAKRPANSCLVTTKLQATFDLHIPQWQDGVNHILDQIV
ncbi:MAG: dTDP-4-dehydrorhamnose reductase [Blastomonas sp.]|uniref:dTDP-4-dehydrorhamnose reductase n=1 Tax=Blastomonas sp. TaxID=1909299 RepID=UPI00406A3F7C|nr:dTDP-4-dehydrorhamnose reductase [Blastomonas sp.]